VTDRIRLRHWWMQAAVVIAAYQSYRFGRMAIRGSREVAFRHAAQIIDAEKKLGLFHEQTLQQWFLGCEPFIRFLDLYYGVAHFVAVVLALVLLWRWAPPRYRFWRNVFGWMLVLGLIAFAVYPLAPPRLMPASFGFVDTAVEIGGFGPLGRETDIGAGGNEFAAMPSLHIAWATWVVVALWSSVSKRWGRGLLVTHLFMTHLAVVITAKHWILDAPAGSAALGGAFLLERTRARITGSGS